MAYPANRRPGGTPKQIIKEMPKVHISAVVPTKGSKLLIGYKAPKSKNR